MATIFRENTYILIKKGSINGSLHKKRIWGGKDACQLKNWPPQKILWRKFFNILSTYSFLKFTHVCRTLFFLLKSTSKSIHSIEYKCKITLHVEYINYRYTCSTYLKKQKKLSIRSNTYMYHTKLENPKGNSSRLLYYSENTFHFQVIPNGMAHIYIPRDSAKSL